MNGIELSISSAQSRAARGLLDLSQSKVAAAAHIGPATLSEFERNDRVPSYNNLQALRAALEAAGIAFVSANGGGPGVRLHAARDGGEYAESPLCPDLCRAARNLLDLSQLDLARAAGIGRSTIADFERGARMPTPENLAAMRTALESAGAAFIAPNGGGPGVRLRE